MWLDSVREATGLPIMASPGLVPEDMLARLADEGVSWYACYQETHNRELFKQLRPGQSYDERLKSKKNAHSLGMLIEEGLLGGIGESSDDIAASIETMHAPGCGPGSHHEFCAPERYPHGRLFPAGPSS